MKKLVNITLFIITMCFIISCGDANSPVKQLFLGITETGEDGPGKIGNVDPTDWLERFNYFTKDSVIGRYSISIPPASPNPTTRYTTLRYLIPANDSIKIWLEDVFGNHTLIKTEYMLAGKFDEKIDLLYDKNGHERKAGIYRLYFSVVTRPEVPLVKGDIELRK